MGLPASTTASGIVLSVVMANRPLRLSLREITGSQFALGRNALVAFSAARVNERLAGLGNELPIVTEPGKAFVDAGSGKCH